MPGVFWEMTDDDLIAFAREFRRAMLGTGNDSNGMCFVICAPLAALLSLSGISALLAESHVRWVTHGRSRYQCPHFWISLADGRALDPTLDQFGEVFGLAFPEIYLGLPLNDIHSHRTNRTGLVA